jgi:hypothetical protein
MITKVICRRGPKVNGAQSRWRVQHADGSRSTLLPEQVPTHLIDEFMKANRKPSRLKNKEAEPWWCNWFD